MTGTFENEELTAIRRFLHCYANAVVPFVGGLCERLKWERGNISLAYQFGLMGEVVVLLACAEV